MVVEKFVSFGRRNFVSAINQNMRVGLDDLTSLKLDDALSSIRSENIKDAIVKKMHSGNTIIVIPNVKGLSSVDPAKTVHLKFNSNGDCLQMTAIAKEHESISSVTYRTPEGVSLLKSFGVKEPWPAYSVYIDKNIGKRYIGEGYVTGDAVGQLFEYPIVTKIVDNEKVVPDTAKSLEQRMAELKQRLVYSSETAEHTPTVLNKEEKAKLAAELNKILETDRYNANSTMEELATAWKRKYISLPFIHLSDPKFEKAILDTFPRVDSSKLRGFGEFEREPLYRWMYIENLPEFLKQFETDGVYILDRRQSCSKYKHYGEFWGGLYPQYNFSNWSKSYNVKFVMHPKGQHPMAADLGEGKYGNLEAIYPAGTKFRIIGKVKNKVTQEEVNRCVSKDIKFDDFERWEIHLQEI